MLKPKLLLNNFLRWPRSVSWVLRCRRIAVVKAYRLPPRLSASSPFARFLSVPSIHPRELTPHHADVVSDDSDECDKYLIYPACGMYRTVYVGPHGIYAMLRPPKRSAVADDIGLPLRYKQTSQLSFVSQILIILLLLRIQGSRMHGSSFPFGFSLVMTTSADLRSRLWSA